MAANANVSSRFRLDASFIYKRGTSPVRQGSGSILQQITFGTTGSGFGVSTKGHQQTFQITPSGTAIIDLNSFTDQLGDPVSWATLMTATLIHDPSSLATLSIEVTGAAGNALPNVRSSRLLKNQSSVLFADMTAGLAITAPNSQIVIVNNDNVNIATAVLFLQGQ